MVYRCLVSPLLRQRCRFLPTCSSYGMEAMEEWGWWQGLGLLVRRLLKCHPWGASGHDPVPKAPFNDKCR